MSADPQSNPHVRVTIDEGHAQVQILRSGTTVEVRDYDSPSDRLDAWKDENERSCHRYVVQSKIASEEWIDSLERFAADLQEHTGVSASFTPDRAPDGLHVLNINKVDYLFYADGSGYDGWGRAP